MALLSVILVRLAILLRLIRPIVLHVRLVSVLLQVVAVCHVFLDPHQVLLVEFVLHVLLVLVILILSLVHAAHVLRAQVPFLAVCVPNALLVMSLIQVVLVLFVRLAFLHIRVECADHVPLVSLLILVVHVSIVQQDIIQTMVVLVSHVNQALAVSLDQTAVSHVELAKLPRSAVSAMIDVLMVKCGVRLSSAVKSVRLLHSLLEATSRVLVAHVIIIQPKVWQLASLFNVLVVSLSSMSRLERIELKISNEQFLLYSILHLRVTVLCF